MRCLVLLTAGFCLLGLTGCVNGIPPLQRSKADNPSPSSVPAGVQATPESSLAHPQPSDKTDKASGTVTEAGGEIWSQLQQVNTRYFVLMRHALAPGTGDPANFQVDDCSTQRNLNEEGREQARRTGEAFRQRNIPVRQVLSSQWCRCLETAELLYIGEVEPFPPLNSFFQDRSTADGQTQQVREFMVNYPDEPGVTVMVTHFVNISALSGSGVSSGAMVVMQVSDDQEVEVVGQIEAF